MKIKKIFLGFSVIFSYPFNVNASYNSHQDLDAKFDFAETDQMPFLSLDKLQEAHQSPPPSPVSPQPPVSTSLSFAVILGRTENTLSEQDTVKPNS